MPLKVETNQHAILFAINTNPNSNCREIEPILIDLMANQVQTGFFAEPMDIGIKVSSDGSLKMSVILAVAPTQNEVGKIGKEGYHLQKLEVPTFEC